MTWNVHGLRSRAAVVAAIRQADPDVLAVQELPRLLWPAWSARRFARAVGMTVVVAGRAARGNALLVRPGLPVELATSLALSHRPGLHRRALARAVVWGLPVVGTHLSLSRDQRAEHLAQVLRALGAGPGVLMGDLNEPAGGPTWTALAAAGLRDAGPADAVTFPGRGTRIDAVLVRGIDVGSAAVDPSDASDHRPVVAELAWPILGR